MRSRRRSSIGIVFHEKLGTVADKVERVAKLARWLVDQGVVKGADADQVGRAARLAKADLVTGMVGEFPELQGVIGGYLAELRASRRLSPTPFAITISPSGRAMRCPRADQRCCRLADKLDTICRFLRIDQRPTGSKDPFALRRAAIGSIELIIRNELRLSLAEAVRGSLAIAPVNPDTKLARRLDRTALELLDFFATG